VFGIQIKKVGQWAQARSLFQRFPGEIKGALRTAVAQEAELLRTKIVQKISSGPFKPLSKTTLPVYSFMGKKHGGKPLIMHGDLLGGVKVVPKGQGPSLFIGIPAAARNRTGQSLVRLASVHEEGRTIVLKMTPKMAAFLHMAFQAAGLPPPGGPSKNTGVIVIQIPARPFMEPAFADWERGHKQRIEQRVIGLLEKRLAGRL